MKKLIIIWIIGMFLLALPFVSAGEIIGSCDFSSKCLNLSSDGFLFLLNNISTSFCVETIGTELVCTESGAGSFIINLSVSNFSSEMIGLDLEYGNLIFNADGGSHLFVLSNTTDTTQTVQNSNIMACYGTNTVSGANDNRMCARLNPSTGFQNVFGGYRQLNAFEQWRFLYNLSTGTLSMFNKTIGGGYTFIDSGVANNAGGNFTLRAWYLGDLFNTLNDYDVTFRNITLFRGSEPTTLQVDNQNPNFGNTSINNSAPRLNEVVALSQIVLDETDLSTFRFASNITGTLVNSSPVTISGLEFNATFNLTVNQVRDTVVGFQWHITDANLNTNQTAISTFTVANTAPPQAVIVFPDDGTVTGLQPLGLNVTFEADADGDVLTINYYIDGILNQSLTTNASFDGDDATYFLEVSLTDGVDHSANVSLTFTIDTVNPLITINAPVNNSVHLIDIPVDLTCNNNQVVNFNYTFFNASEVFQFKENNTVINPLTTEATLVDSINTTPLSIGTYTLQTNCLDNASNVATQFLSLNFTIAPVVPPPTETELFQSRFFSAIVAIGSLMVVISLLVGAGITIRNGFRRS